MTHCKMAIEILQKTNDGRELFQTPQEIERHGRNGDGWQLKCIENAVNGFLTPAGVELFETLYDKIMVGDAAYSLRDFLAKFLPTHLDCALA